MKKLIILQLMPLIVLTQLQAASFKCKYSTTTVEKTICSEKNLSALDDYLSITYKEALRNNSNKDKIKNLQRNWIKNKRNICKDDYCIRDAYISQIKKLQLNSNTKFSGHYVLNEPSNCTADIDILQFNDNKIYLHGISVTKSRGHNIGEVEGFFPVNNNKVHYKNKSEYADGITSFTITFKKDSLVITNSINNGEWGIAVDFDGEYKKK